MPIQYQRDDEKRRIFIHSDGVPVLEDVLGTMDRQAADGAWSYSVQYDSRGTVRGPTPEELHQILLHIGKLTAKHGPRGPVAMIVGDPQVFKAAKRYASLGELTALRVELFATTEAAETWLDSLQRV